VPEITDTKDRLVAAAAELFAERGFHGTKARDIAERAGVNLAASNYHYGSKRDLYVEVLRGQFADIRGELARRGATPPASPSGGKLSRKQLQELLLARAQVMLEVVLGSRLHGALMQREMCDPSEALPLIVDEFVRPNMLETRSILAELAPELSPEELDLCTNSIVGQVLFYRFAMPMLLQMSGRRSYSKGFTKKLAEHVSEFALGGLERIVRRHRHAQ